MSEARGRVASGSPTISAEWTAGRTARLRVKRFMDVAVSLAAALVLLPLVAIIVAAIALGSRGPILYRHVRIGYGGRAFDCLKFRTMYRDAQQRLLALIAADPRLAAQWAIERKLDRDPRITPVGRLLRATSLDEIPQLINVLCGEMSLVGPRPITGEELLRYGASARHYRKVSPGITGRWQVSGRNDVNYAERVRLDDRYVREWTLLGDLVILLRTPLAVLTGRGAR